MFVFTFVGFAKIPPEMTFLYGSVASEVDYGEDYEDTRDFTPGSSMSRYKYLRTPTDFSVYVSHYHVWKPKILPFGLPE